VRITIEIDDEEIRRVLGPLSLSAGPIQAQPNTRLLTVKEVADQLGVSRSKAYQLVVSGAIQSLAIGRSRRVSPGAVAEFIARPSADSPEPYSPPRYERERPPSYRKPTPAALPKPEQPPRRRRKAVYEIDLSPKPLESSDRWMTDEEWEKSLSGLGQERLATRHRRANECRPTRRTAPLSCVRDQRRCPILGFEPIWRRKANQDRQVASVHDRSAVSG
jgi:excisionase family DNA binding protein